MKAMNQSSMASPKANNSTDKSFSPPSLTREDDGRIDGASLANLLDWFLQYDQRVAIIKHPKVEELFQWKQEKSRREGENVFAFDHAEDRLAVGIVQALAEHANERALHRWISQLLNALEEATQINEEIAGSYKLITTEESSTVTEAAKIPSLEAREMFLTCCWLEALCTAEIRVLGWIYQELYGRAFHPDNA